MKTNQISKQEALFIIVERNIPCDMFTFHIIQHKKLFAVRENKASNRIQSNQNTAPEDAQKVTRTINKQQQAA